jgi:hypothetical protein
MTLTYYGRTLIEDLTPEAMCRCEKHGQLHLLVAVSGLSFICLNSLLDTPKQVVEV